jgi:hypothetical protein
VEWAIIIGCVAVYFWRKNRSNTSKDALPEQGHKRFALYYLSHLLDTHRYDETSQLAIDHLLRCNSANKLANAFMGNLSTQQNLLARVQRFTEFEALEIYNPSDISTALVEVRKLFESQGSAVNSDPKVALMMNQLMAQNPDIEAQYNFKLDAVAANVAAMFEQVFGEGFHDYQRRLYADVLGGDLRRTKNPVKEV